MISSISSQAQQIKSTIRHYTAKDGMTSPFLKDITQDDQGFLWLAHRKGLDRFDGREFQSFPFPDSIIDYNTIQDIAYDNAGKLWLVNSDIETILFDIHSEQYLAFDEIFEKEDNITQADILEWREINGHIYITTHEYDIYLYDHKFQKILDSDVSGLNNKNYLIDSSFLFYAEENQLIQKSFSGKTLKTYTAPFKIGCIQSDNRGQTWIAEYDTENDYRLGVIQEGKLNIITLDKSPDNRNRSSGFEIFYDQRGAYSIRSDFHWVTYDHNFRPWIDLAKASESHSTFKVTGFLKTYRDKIGNYWGISDAGLVFMNTTLEKFDRIFFDENIPVSTSGIIEIDDIIYTNIYSGGRSCNLKSKDNLSWQTDPEETILKKIDNFYWTAGYHHNIHYGPIDNIKRYVLHKSDLADNSRANDLIKDSNGTIWLATSSKLSILNSTDSTFYAHPTLPMDIGYNYLFEDGPYVWAATFSGLYRIDKTTKEFKAIEAIGNKSLTHFVKRKDGKFWLVSYHSGLLMWDPKTNETKSITQKDGLSSVFLNSIHEDRFGYLWITSDNGLMRYNTTNDYITIFREEDGIAHNSFNISSSYQSKNDILYLGGLNGITIVNPALFLDIENKSRPIIFTNIEVLKGNTWEKQPYNISSLDLGPNDRSIKCDFVNIDFLKGHQLKYSYYLDGVDQQWNSLDGNTVRFSSLPSGKHTLKIRAQDSYPDKYLELPISVRPPFTRTFGFYLILFGLAYLLYNIRIRYLKNQQLNLERIIAERTADLRSSEDKLRAAIDAKDKIFGIVAHDLRNAAISFRGVREKTIYLLKSKQVDRIVEMGEHIETAARNSGELLNNLINWARSEQDQLPFKPATLDLRTISEKAIAITEGLKANKAVTVDNLIPKQEKIYADPVGLEIILRNLISNAIKYSYDDSVITLSSKKIDNKIRIEIKDDGVGIAPDKIDDIFSLRQYRSHRGTAGEKGSGIGLMLVHSIVAQHSGNIQVKSELNKGSTFQIDFPLPN